MILNLKLKTKTVTFFVKMFKNVKKYVKKCKKCKNVKKYFKKCKKCKNVKKYVKKCKKCKNVKKYVILVLCREKRDLL